MAERRMFAKNVIDSDLFLDMPLSTQALYFHLAMRADDDGFVNNPKKITRMIGANDDSLKLLCAKQFIIPFENGIVVIKHWRIHNYIRKDTYKETSYKAEKSRLSVDSSEKYILRDESVTGSSQVRDDIVDGSLTQDSIGKVSIGKVSINIYDEFESEFESIWKRYPKKQGKENALKAYIKAREDKKKPVTADEVLEGLDRYIAYIKANNVSEKYIKHGSTWFNQRCWEDDYSRQTFIRDENDPMCEGFI